MERECFTCGKHYSNNPDDRTTCSVDGEGGRCDSDAYPRLHKWVLVRDIYKDNATGKVIEHIKDTNFKVLHASYMEVGSNFKESYDSIRNYYTRLNYSEYKKYLPKATIKENTQMKYKKLRNINGVELNKDNACQGEFDNYVMKYGYHRSLVWNKDTEDYMLTNKTSWIQFLINKKYIEKIESKKYKLKYGDIVVVNAYLCRLFQIDYSVGMFFRIYSDDNKEKYNRNDGEKITLSIEYTKSTLEDMGITNITRQGEVIYNG